MDTKQIVSRIRENIAQAIVGKDEVVELVLIALMSQGHVLIEDVPGMGKTALVSSLARSVGCTFAQASSSPPMCCPAILPASPCPAARDSSNSGPVPL